MKAKEIAKEFLEKIENDPAKITGKVARDIFGTFLQDGQRLITDRKASSDEACQSCIEEISDKWKAFTNHVNTKLDGNYLKPSGFKDLVEHETGLQLK